MSYVQGCVALFGPFLDTEGRKGRNQWPKTEKKLLVPKLRKNILEAIFVIKKV